MIVQVLAYTKTKPYPLHTIMPAREVLHEDGYIDHLDYPTDPDTLSEFAGRACYQSFNRPRPETASNVGYLANILRQGHESVLEHASVTFYIESVSRSLSHELVRHRHLSFSQLSQRYVDESEADFVMPPAVAHGMAWEAEKSFSQATRTAQIAYQAIVDVLVGQGLPRKQAREAARSVLPNATETKLVVTGNLRAWRDVLRKRWHVAADAEIRALAGEILRHLREIAPASVQDIPDMPYGTKEAA
ncbi:FAD-dependent thymidylate synthase [Crossiella sp. CA-258035]|uniref:FAD-dependent thymidylate synthase n=1 Tax=Crossiella sp. CA-258035 TaxID=2981138 RepID=UPI0024BC9C01|nr:FAD-dependent thymidylate synthase [Crossiella sp. CA-258035]WHT20999.1 FAD-dependent thymidylate synthase [Crossiella sp. CA-258035]